MKALLACTLLSIFWVLPSLAQYRNFEIQPNGTGGYMGTYGNENFDVDVQNGSVSGTLGGRRPGMIREHPSQSQGNVGATQRRCFVDGNGAAICR